MRVVLSGGGSGGHIYPAMAIARGLRDREAGVKLCYIGTQHGLERDLVPRAQIPFQTIHAHGLLVRGLKGKMTGALSLVLGVFDAWRILRRERPDVVVGTGGYVSGPVGLAAALLHIPLVIQEQNAWPGFTNRHLAKHATAVLVPWQEAVKHFPAGSRIVIAGNPIDLPASRLTRAEAKKSLALKAEIRLLMATGGSQGAEAVNRLMLTLLPRVIADSDLGMIWATGKRYYPEVMKMVRERFGSSLDTTRIQIFEYFYQIQRVYQAADLAVGRAGAMTLTDCEAFGIPAVLIPSPHVSEDHQTKNAQVIEARGAALALREDDIPERSDEVLSLLRDEERCQEMGARMASLFDAEALSRIMKTVVAASRTSRRG